ncbi:hypothetical protein Dxin01_00072 [Deinococcus xinjiangensis]|uniref:Uncharacterized protein n=1 Tax=Deinococcus xinjiangensis TaxID=457454 RepID=A0ABP9V4Z3_9DEIO
MSPKAKKQPTARVTTTGRTKDASTQKPRAAHPAVEPTLRPINPDAHGGAGETEETAASKLEQEADTGHENRY